MKMRKALVLGGGAFGTSMASILSHNFEQVIIQVRSQDVYDCLKAGENKVYLPGHKLSANIRPSLSWEETEELCGDEVDLIMSGLPMSALSGYFKDNGEHLRPYMEKGTALVSLTKGINPDTLELPDDIYFSAFPEFRENIFFLSGPSFAQEILEGHITLLSLAGKSRKELLRVGKMIETSYVKVFPTYDVKGLLLGGALKNILAIAGGIVEGLGYNHNTRAALITKGIHEVLRFGVVVNARPETFYGLSGVGDIILSTTGGLSRNKVFGLELAKGEQTAEEILKSKRRVVEGYGTTKAAFRIAEKYDIRCHIFKGVYEVLYENKKPVDVIKKLMNLPARFEIEVNN